MYLLAPLNQYVYRTNYQSVQIDRTNTKLINKNFYLRKHPTNIFCIKQRKNFNRCYTKKYLTKKKLALFWFHFLFFKNVLYILKVQLHFLTVYSTDFLQKNMQTIFFLSFFLSCNIKSFYTFTLFVLLSKLVRF